MRIPELTEEIKLPIKLQKKYNIARIALHVVFAVAVLFVSFRILFPTVPFDFNMNTPTAIKNTMTAARLEETGQFPTGRVVESNKTLLFNASPLGQFSKAEITITTDKNSSSIEDAQITTQKSYQAFLYPTGEPVGFADGTLLSTTDGNYYIVSNGLLRKFANTDTILKMGYPKSAFTNVSTEDLKLNKQGDDISDVSNYPDDTLFLIDNNFYQLKNQQLSEFVSAQAYLSQFETVSAIAKNVDFLTKYETSENQSGFADGTLVSSTDSVFLLTDGKAFPIENEVTFGVMGFDWNDVIKVGSDELSAYAKQKQFTDDNPHPNGIIFFDQATDETFIVSNGKKNPITNKPVLATFSKRKKITVDSSQAAKKDSCILKKKMWSSNEFTCEISLENLTT
ncbi:MAG: hypothetical protein WCI36_05705, partial [bacterium]